MGNRENNAGCPYCQDGIFSTWAYDTMVRLIDNGMYCKHCGRNMVEVIAKQYRLDEKEVDNQ